MNRSFLIAALALSAAASAHAADAPLAEWVFENDTAGWTARADCRLEAGDGVMKVKCTGNDPQLTAPVSAPPGWKVLTIRAKLRGNFNGQLFWMSGDDGDFAEQHSVKFTMRSRDAKFRNYKVYFKPERELTGLRLDPHRRRSSLEIASIALASGEPPRPQATPVSSLKLPPGFQAELLYSVPSQAEGSWVCLTHDDQGRLITSDQYGKLYRVTPPPIGGDDEIEIEPIPVDIGMAQGLLYAFDSLYVSINGKGPGLYRVRDTDGDDQFDDVKLLREFRGSSEHGPHAVILGPDGKSLYVAAGNHTELPNPEQSLVPRNWQEDQLLPRMWDAGGHAVGRMAPGGWICRTDPDGKKFELVSIGFRNEYDIAFHPNGDLFTYDADMEWDVGTPWYRPTRVNHVIAGAEFGWRSGTGKWPEYYPDSLPSVVDIGPGSPTGVVFGSGARFPEKYQRAVFICDWSYGVIYAVHLDENGATYTGQPERFVSAAPLPVTDIIVNPHDRALYFTIGGRRTQSGLYRVTYTGDASTEPVETREVNPLVKTRRRLEAAYKSNDPSVIENVWPFLSHEDRYLRYAARVAVEHQPVERWQERALVEPNPRARIRAAIALARNGEESLKPRLVECLAALDFSELDRTDRLALLRAYGLTFARMGEPSPASRELVLAQVDDKYPSDNYFLNKELSRLLIYLEAPDVVTRTLDLLEQAPTQHEQLHYALCLRSLKSGWTLDQRRRYFEWFNRAAAHRGGHSFGGFLTNIRNEAIETLSDEERKQLEPILEAVPEPVAATLDTKREVVKKWTVAELLPKVEAGLTGRDYQRGRELFAATNCFKCHRFAGQGGIVGPDLTGAGRRFNNRDLLTALIEPNKTISDQYQATQFVLESGRVVVGRVANLNGDRLMVSENMLDPGNLTAVNRNEIELMQPSRTSMMPAGLLDTLTEPEILDLIAYLKSGGNPQYAAFGE